MSFAEISDRIAEAIKGVVVGVFDFLQPILMVLGVAQILLGLLIAVGLKQEFIGYRLILSGALTLIFNYIVLPLLLGFI